MLPVRLLALGCCICGALISAQPAISTYAGGPPVNGTAFTVSLPRVNEIKADAFGNVYICLEYLHVVYKLDTSGNLSIIAGTGVAGFNGDNGPATSARLSSPKGLALDKLGNLYIADTGNHRVRKVVLATGIITTIAGSDLPRWFGCQPAPCNAGDGGPAISAAVEPGALAVDSLNSLYIADGARVRKIADGTITTVAGNDELGYTGDGGPATQARLDYVGGLAIDSSDSLYIADSPNSAVRKVKQGIITTVIGSGAVISASLFFPWGLAFDSSGSLYIGDANNLRVLKVSSGTVSTVATARAIGGVAVDRDDHLLFTDLVSGRVSKVVNGVTTAIAGSDQFYFNGDSIPAASANLAPEGTNMALDAQGNLYFADPPNHRVRKISPDGTVTTVAGMGFYGGFSGDNGPATAAQLNWPRAVAVDAIGQIYIADWQNNRIRLVDTKGIITTYAGTGRSGYNGDGLPRTQTSIAPWFLTLDNSGFVYFIDAASNRIRKIADGIVTTVLGTGMQSSLSTCRVGPATSFDFGPQGTLAFGPGGVLYFIDEFSQCLQRLNHGVVDLVAGGGKPDFRGDGGPAGVAKFWIPKGLAFDAAGNLYVADSGNNRIRRISNGTITTVVGHGPAGVIGTFGGDWGPPRLASLNLPVAITPDGNGNLFIADTGNFRIRKVSHVSPTMPRDFAGTGLSGVLLYDPVSGLAYTGVSLGNSIFSYTGNTFTPDFDIVRTGDFNGDQKADLVVYNSHTALAYIGISSGDGTFAFQSLFWSPGYDFVEPGDLDGDNRTDFALYNSATGTMYTAISNGTGTFTYKYTLISKGYTFLRLADFTGDGKADIFLYNASSGATFIGIGDGAGGFAFQPLFVSPSYNLADIGDLNGDGKADLILYNSINGNTATGISDGSGGFAYHPMPFSPGFTSVRLADYTGDGKADVTLYNKATGSAYFGTGTGTGTFNFQSLFWSPGYDTVEPQDVNGDGKMDVVLYNSLTGTEYTGLSDGSGAFSYTYQYWGTGRMLAK